MFKKILCAFTLSLSILFGFQFFSKDSVSLVVDNHTFNNGSNEIVGSIIEPRFFTYQDINPDNYYYVYLADSFFCSGTVNINIGVPLTYSSNGEDFDEVIYNILPKVTNTSTLYSSRSLLVDYSDDEQSYYSILPYIKGIVANNSFNGLRGFNSSFAYYDLYDEYDYTYLESLSNYLLFPFPVSPKYLSVFTGDVWSGNVWSNMPFYSNNVFARSYIDNYIRFVPLDNSFNYAYNSGFINGQFSSDIDSYSNGYNVGLDDGYSNGYNVGYSTGYNQAITNVGDEPFNNLLFTIADIPFKAFKEIWNFEIFGVNVAASILSLVSLLLVIFIIKKVI